MHGLTFARTEVPRMEVIMSALALRPYRVRTDFLDSEEAPDVLPMLLSKQGKKVYRDRLWARHPHCHFCGRKIGNSKDATIDHGIPESRGGLNTPQNLLLACAGCNLTKGCRTVEEWVHDILNGAEPCMGEPGAGKGGA